MPDTYEIRASSFGDLMDCPSRWEAIHILGMRSAASVPAHMGTSIHFGSAIYDTARAEGRHAFIDEAVGATVHRFEHPGEDIRWTADDYSKRDALAISIKCTESYCHNLSPLFEFQGVELRLPPIDIELEAGSIVLRVSGRMDRARIVKGGAGSGVSDVKTGRVAVAANGRAVTAGHKFQLGIYELLLDDYLQAPITEPARILGVQTTHKARTGVGEVTGAKDLMLGTDTEPGIIEMAGKMLKEGLFPPNPRSRLCSEKWCPRWHTCKAHD